MHLSIATSFKDQCLKTDAQLREALQPVVSKTDLDLPSENNITEINVAEENSQKSVGLNICRCLFFE